MGILFVGPTKSVVTGSVELGHARCGLFQAAFYATHQVMYHRRASLCVSLSVLDSALR